jgi:hypothetical protein
MPKALLTALMLGSSAVTWSDGGPERSMPKLLEAELSRRMPDAGWSCRGEEIPPGRDLRERVSASVEAARPSVVALDASASYFTYDYVVARIWRSWPWLFGASRSFGGALKAAFGHGFEGSRSRRGWLFQLPRSLAVRVIGAEPYMNVEHASTNMRDALEYLAGRQAMVSICKLPTIAPDLPGRPRRVVRGPAAPVQHGGQ